MVGLIFTKRTLKEGLSYVCVTPQYLYLPVPLVAEKAGREGGEAPVAAGGYERRLPPGGNPLGFSPTPLTPFVP